MLLNKETEPNQIKTDLAIRYSLASYLGHSFGECLTPLQRTQIVYSKARQQDYF